MPNDDPTILRDNDPRLLPEEDDFDENGKQKPFRAPGQFLAQQAKYELASQWMLELDADGR